MEIEIFSLTFFTLIKISFSDSLCSKASFAFIKIFIKTWINSFSYDEKIILWTSCSTVIWFVIKVAFTKSNAFFIVFLISKFEDILSLLKKLLKSSIVFDRYWVVFFICLIELIISSSLKIPNSFFTSIPEAKTLMVDSGCLHWWAMFSIISPIDAILDCWIEILFFSSFFCISIFIFSWSCLFIFFSKYCL